MQVTPQKRFLPLISCGNLYLLPIVFVKRLYKKAAWILEWVKLNYNKLKKGDEDENKAYFDGFESGTDIGG